jgi:iron(III) transport system substrate-binding protein
MGSLTNALRMPCMRPIVVGVALLVLLLTACGGSDDEPQSRGFEAVFADIQGLTGKAREQKLLQLVEAEGGELSFYTSIPSFETVQEAFEEAYDVDLAVYRASASTVAQRLREEADAGFHGADVVDANGYEIAGLAREGLFVPYQSEYRAKLVEAAKQDGWTASRFATFVVSWNTKLVDDGEQPRSWEDLADPRWDGKIALELDDVEWYKTLRDHWVEQGKTEEEADRLFAGMADDALVIKGHDALSQLTAAGEFHVAASSYRHVVEDLRKKDAPLAWQPAVEPTIVLASGMGLIDGAQHPAAAILFADWLLGDGQQVIEEVGYSPAQQGPADARQLPVDIADLLDNREEWIDRYERVLQRARKVESEG